MMGGLILVFSPSQLSHFYSYFIVISLVHLQRYVFYFFLSYFYLGEEFKVVF